MFNTLVAVGHYENFDIYDVRTGTLVAYVAGNEQSAELYLNAQGLDKNANLAQYFIECNSSTDAYALVERTLNATIMHDVVAYEQGYVVDADDDCTVYTGKLAA